MNKPDKVETVAGLFEVMGGTTSVARHLGVRPSTASEIKRRGRIPSEYWRQLIAAARRSGHLEITADLLVDLHARVPEPLPAGLAEEERPFEPAVAASADSKEPGQFSRFKHLRRAHFGSLADVNAHISALRDEWERR
ncbi:MAG: hypothetical protein WBF58_05275 [Xanthobacteraceae bacterium]